MHAVLNVVTIVQLEIAARAHGMSVEKLPSEVLAMSHTMQYAETPLVQSGHRVASARIVGGDRSFSIKALLEMMRSEGYGKSVEKAEQLMKEHGIKEDEHLLAGFDINADVAPEH